MTISSTSLAVSGSLSVPAGVAVGLGDVEDLTGWGTELKLAGGVDDEADVMGTPDE